MTDFARLLACLTDARVEFVVIGGFAATAHGSAHVTVDLDIVYRRTTDNIRHLAGALTPLAPYLRGAPPGLPFVFDVGTIMRGLNFTLSTCSSQLESVPRVVKVSLLQVRDGRRSIEVDAERRPARLLRT